MIGLHCVSIFNLQSVTLELHSPTILLSFYDNLRLHVSCNEMIDTPMLLVVIILLVTSEYSDF